MKKVTLIFNFLKKLFGQEMNVNIENNSKYNINKNRKCNININDGESNGKRN